MSQSTWMEHWDTKMAFLVHVYTFLDGPGRPPVYPPSTGVFPPMYFVDTLWVHVYPPLVHVYPHMCIQYVWVYAYPHGSMCTHYVSRVYPWCMTCVLMCTEYVSTYGSACTKSGYTCQSRAIKQNFTLCYSIVCFYCNVLRWLQPVFKTLTSTKLVNIYSI